MSDYEELSELYAELRVKYDNLKERYERLKATKVKRARGTPRAKAAATANAIKPIARNGCGRSFVPILPTGFELGGSAKNKAIVLADPALCSGLPLACTQRGRKGQKRWQPRNYRTYSALGNALGFKVACLPRAIAQELGLIERTSGGEFARAEAVLQSAATALNGADLLSNYPEIIAAQPTSSTKSASGSLRKSSSRSGSPKRKTTRKPSPKAKRKRLGRKGMGLPVPEAQELLQGLENKWRRSSSSNLWGSSSASPKRQTMRKPRTKRTRVGKLRSAARGPLDLRAPPTFPASRSKSDSSMSTTVEDLFARGFERAEPALSPGRASPSLSLPASSSRRRSSSALKEVRRNQIGVPSRIPAFSSSGTPSGSSMDVDDEELYF